MPEQAKTTTKRTGSAVRTTGSVTAATAVPVAADRPVAPTVASPSSPSDVVAPTSTRPVEPPTSPLTRPEPSPRSGVRVNVATLENAFLDATRSRSVAHVQRALRARGLDVRTVTGVVDFDTRAAYAAFQRTIDERPTGLPTVRSLDYLGFDVVG